MIKIQQKLIHSSLMCISAVSTLTLLTLLTGCSKPSLVGKWKGVQNIQSPMGAQSVDINTEYKSDGTFAQDVNTKMGNISVKGTYKVEGDKVTSALSSLDAPPMIKAVAEPMLKKSINQTTAFKIEGDTLTLSKDSGALTMSRVK